MIPCYDFTENRCQLWMVEVWSASEIKDDIEDYKLKVLAALDEFMVSWPCKWAPLLQVSCKIRSCVWVPPISISPPRSLSVSEADCNHMGCEDGVLPWGVWHNPFRWFSFQWRSVFYFLQITELAYPQHLYKDTDDLCCGESSQAKLRPSLVSRFLPLRTELGLCSWKGADLLTQTAGTPGLEKSFCDLYYHQAKIWYLWSLLRLRTWGQRREAIWTWISIYNERK